jgi:hypothetical protein
LVVDRDAASNCFDDLGRFGIVIFGVERKSGGGESASAGLFLSFPELLIVIDLLLFLAS